jgi:hypothetical protein
MLMHTKSSACGGPLWAYMFESGVCLLFGVGIKELIALPSRLSGTLSISLVIV